MKTHYVDLEDRPEERMEGYDVGICGSQFQNYHDCRAVPLPGQERRFFDASEGVDCQRCLKIFALQLN